jgi:hypothetical protein
MKFISNSKEILRNSLEKGYNNIMHYLLKIDQTEIIKEIRNRADMSEILREKTINDKNFEEIINNIEELNENEQFTPLIKELNEKFGELKKKIINYLQTILPKFLYFSNRYRKNGNFFSFLKNKHIQSFFFLIQIIIQDNPAI